jgi:hypothetical protein
VGQIASLSTLSIHETDASLYILDGSTVQANLLLPPLRGKPTSCPSLRSRRVMVIWMTRTRRYVVLRAKLSINIWACMCLYPTVSIFVFAFRILPCLIGCSSQYASSAPYLIIPISAPIMDISYQQWACATNRGFQTETQIWYSVLADGSLLLLQVIWSFIGYAFILTLPDSQNLNSLGMLN